jgi:hypothetical protein
MTKNHFGDGDVKLRVISSSDIFAVIPDGDGIIFFIDINFNKFTEF